MGQFHDERFPGESDAYRETRDRLLAAEKELRLLNERIAALRRGLPLGGRLKEDYTFEEGDENLSDLRTVNQTKFSELFDQGKKSLIVYSFMYAPDGDPCPMCTAMLDGLNGSASHVRDRINFAVVAKASIQKIRNWALKRDWQNLRLLSSAENTYNTDYKAEQPSGMQYPAINVFQKTVDGIFHTYNAELLYVPPEEGQNPRHVDLIFPLWTMFDLTPEGRGGDWFPATAYDE